MFEQNYGSKDTKWLRWLMGVAVIYALLTAFPVTERLAEWIGVGLTAVVLSLFRTAVRDWIVDKVGFHGKK